ncbi:MAG: hypothetical protein KKH61_21225 [Gammaproteobacteria bacterium]|uniref:Uncharacterized protein n=1 Tax=viral metagenome TaxID=1070528 RepID=A0A6H1Z9P2_9ZZZZ|nr:hypothetical protein [Gammaproteobacteria bacterium]
MATPRWCYVGATIICVNDKGWRDVFGFVSGTMDGPTFMQACIITGVEYLPKLRIAGVTLEGYGPLKFAVKSPDSRMWMFRPPVKLHDEQETRVSEPV